MKKAKRLYVQQTASYNSETREYDAAYSVKRVINSTDLRIKEQLSKEQLNNYCIASDWQVTIS